MFTKKKVLTLIFILLSTLFPHQVFAEGFLDNLVTSKTSPIIFTRTVHSPTETAMLKSEKFRILANMFFWQGDSKKLAIFKPDLNAFTAIDSYPYTAFHVTRSGSLYTVGGNCTGSYIGMSECSNIVREKIGAGISVNMPSPGFLDNHDLTVDLVGNYWGIRYLNYPAKYFNEFFEDSATSNLVRLEKPVDMVSDCEVIEFNKSGKILYRWSALREFPASEVRDAIWEKNPTGVLKTGADGLVYADLFHCNSIDVHPSGEKFLISARHTDSIYEVDVKSYKVLWKIGGNKLFGKSLEVIDSTGQKVNSFSVFGGQHDARYVGSNQITVFDNSTNYKRPARGLLFTLEKSRGKAVLVSTFNDPSGNSSGCTGSFRKISVTKSWYVAGWGCTKSGITVFNSSGKAVVSLAVTDDERNNKFRPIIPIENTGSMISYRVTPHVFSKFENF